MPNIVVPGIGSVDSRCVKRTLRVAGKLKDIADAMEVSQGAVSKWLSGVNAIPPEFTVAMFDIFRTFDQGPNGKAVLPTQPADALAQVRIDWEKDINPLTGESFDFKTRAPATNEQTTVQHPTSTGNWKVDALNAYPWKEWTNFVNSARKAHSEGQTYAPVGPRMSITVKHAYLALVNDGFEHESAFNEAVKHTVIERVLDSDQEFFMNLFFTEFGRRLQKGLNLHPNETKTEPRFAAYMKSYIKFGIPVWVYGSPGAGKTYATRQIAQEMNRGFVRVPCSKFLTTEEVFAGLEITDGKSYAKDGMITSLVRQVHEGTIEGAIICIDEFSRLQPGLSTTFHSLMEMDELVVPLTGERIPVDRTKIAIVINDNLKGLAEDAAFTGAEPVDEATRDRCVFLPAEYPNKTVEKYIVEESVKWVPDARLSLRFR